jgi:tRNA-specific 2-thiouridylase
MNIAVLLSGGVDSSVSLRLLRERTDADITAFYLKVWLEDEVRYLGDCPWEEDLAFARAVCEEAGVPLEVVSLQREYFDRVVQYALDELKEGRTPSPDIFCNQRIKFGVFYDEIGSSFDKVATGHYSRISERGGLYRLDRAPDPVKDQSYFLSHLSQEQLARALFPIGSMHKREVRNLADNYDLPNKNRKDSQGICFLGKIRYPEFIRHYLGERPGKILERESGRVLGEHHGYWFHTIGQRQGLGLGNGPWYVVAKDVGANIVFVSHKEHLETRERRRFTVGDPSWIAETPEGGRFEIKLRHGPELHACTMSWIDRGRMEIAMDEPDEGIAPGQFAVFYRGTECLGGARIEAAIG